MNGKHTPTDFGELAPKPTVRPAPPAIPRSLRGQTLTWKSSNYEESVALYGLWEMRCLKSTMVAGRVIEPGDTFKVPGHDAVLLASYGTAEFKDERVLRESKALEEVKSLGLDKPPRISGEPAFAPQKQRTKIADVGQPLTRE